MLCDEMEVCASVSIAVASQVPRESSASEDLFLCGGAVSSQVWMRGRRMVFPPDMRSPDGSCPLLPLLSPMLTCLRRVVGGNSTLSALLP